MTHRILNILIAGVWLVNGLFCKILNLVPRHQEIIARILGDEHSRTLTILIGVLETGMAIWILTGIWPRISAWVQIVVIAAMNILEFILLPDLLLWGKANIIFAGILILVIYYNNIYHKAKTVYT